MANPTIRPAKIYKNGRMVSTATQKGMTQSGNVTIVSADGGNQLQIGVPQGSFNVDMTVPRGDTIAMGMLLDLKNHEIVRVIFAEFGGKYLQADCIVSEFNLTSTTADGSKNASATLQMVNGEPELVG